MTILKSKQCLDCGNEFQPSGPAAKYCTTHAEERRKERGRRDTQNYRIKHGLVQKPGVGKGGNNAKGVEDGQYQTGIMFFQRIRRKIKEDRRYCENPECGKDLIDATRWGWVIHHRDHDRTHNTEENFQLLCKSCHQIEHECYLNFNVQRLSGKPE